LLQEIFPEANMGKPNLVEKFPQSNTSKSRNTVGIFSHSLFGYANLYIGYANL